MSRNTRLSDHHEVKFLDHHHVRGPFSWLNPTHAQLELQPSKETESDPSAAKLETNEINNGKASFLWRARDNRKGRHAVILEPADDPNDSHDILYTRTDSMEAVWKGIWRMVTQYPYWDISYLVATIFTWGSVVWVINAFFVYLPLVQPSTMFHDEVSSGGGITAFIGATIFEFGSILLILEAWNENRSACFGWALEKVWDEKTTGKKAQYRLARQDGSCQHHHSNSNNFIGQSQAHAENEEPTNPTSDRGWAWLPTWHELSTHYIFELGFLASASQLFGATIFWISGFTALPGLVNQDNQKLLNGVYWIPQMIGGSGFIVSGILYMLETQKKWYIPAFDTLGWHIAVWNLIGGIGFTLSGALGPAAGNSGAEYESSLATFWGSWAFLIGSTIQWYESLDKYPVIGPDSKKH